MRLRSSRGDSGSEHTQGLLGRSDCRRCLADVGGGGACRYRCRGDEASASAGLWAAKLVQPGRVLQPASDTDRLSRFRCRTDPSHRSLVPYCPSSNDLKAPFGNTHAARQVSSLGAEPPPPCEQPSQIQRLTTAQDVSGCASRRRLTPPGNSHARRQPPAPNGAGGLLDKLPRKRLY